MTSNAISWNIVKKDVDPGFTVKATLSRKVAKLTRRLAGFAPETLHLQVLLERLPRKRAFTAKFTLRLPSHILHSEKSAENLPAAIDSATEALAREVDSLRSKLRGDYRWKRPAWRARLNEEKTLMFAEPVEDETGPQTLAEVVASLIAAHDEQLLAHARRVLHMAELTGDIPTGAIDARDSVNEVVRICLAALEKKPSDLTYEEWFYRLVAEETGRQIREFTEETRLRVSPIGETSRSQTEAADNAESPLQWVVSEITPDEDLPEERIPDPAVIPPSVEVSGHELVKILDHEVKTWPPAEREVFELHYLVGFNEAETAAICSQTKEEVDASLRKIELRLRNFLRQATAIPGR
jgi:DNA-directed RNA polymerase specialized sigma24 family protein/ribosome-associated translation inhibitor RaiA